MKYKIGDNVIVTKNDAYSSGLKKGTLLTIMVVEYYTSLYRAEFSETSMVLYSDAFVHKNKLTDILYSIDK